MLIQLNDIHLSPTNPRRDSSPALDAELVESIKRHGILQPVLVRPVAKKGKPWELIAGSRRFHAAKVAGLTEIPALEKPLTDLEVLEVQIVENLQRSDVHPLEEAEAFRKLHHDHKYDVARIAEAVGRSIPYVYDRMRLAQLIPAAQEQFRAGRFAAAHANLLARLKPDQQALAIDPDQEALYEWVEPELGVDPGSSVAQEHRARPAREFSAWIDRTFRLDVHAEELPELFPDVAEKLSEAQDEAMQVVEITWAIRPPGKLDPESASSGSRVLPCARWKPADGKTSDISGKVWPTCERSKLGVVVIGSGRGSSLLVCADKKCTVHWKDELRKAELKHLNSQPHADDPKAAAAREKERKKRELEERRRVESEENRTRWRAALPEIRRQLAASIAKAGPAVVSGYLAEVVINHCESNWGDFRLPQAKKLMLAKKDPASAIRLAALLLLGQWVGSAHNTSEVVKDLKRGLKFDAQAIVDVKSAKTATTKKTARPKKASA